MDVRIPLQQPSVGVRWATRAARERRRHRYERRGRALEERDAALAAASHSGGLRGRRKCSASTRRIRDYSDAQGNFRFDDIDPGSYILSAQRNGYLIATYGKEDGAADRIDVGSGQSVTGIAVKMTPQAVITGKILDEDGDPVLGARVTVARWSYQNGKRQLLNRGGGSSDFEGVYSVANLQAGSYILMVVPQPNLLGNVQQKGVVETVPPTYYPGVTDPAAATAIQVAAGAIRIRGTIAGDSSVGRVVSLMPEGGFDTLPLV